MMLSLSLSSPLGQHGMRGEWIPVSFHRAGARQHAAHRIFHPPSKTSKLTALDLLSIAGTGSSGSRPATETSCAPTQPQAGFHDSDDDDDDDTPKQSMIQRLRNPRMAKAKAKATVKAAAPKHSPPPASAQVPASTGKATRFSPVAAGPAAKESSSVVNMANDGRFTRLQKGVQDELVKRDLEFFAAVGLEDVKDFKLGTQPATMKTAIKELNRLVSAYKQIATKITKSTNKSHLETELAQAGDGQKKSQAAAEYLKALTSSKAGSSDLLQKYAEAKDAGMNMNPSFATINWCEE